MKENTRRMVLFAVIVATGSILIFVDIPLVYMLPLIMGVGFLLLVLLGSITVTDIKNAVSKLTLKNLRQQPFLKKLGSLKRSGKKTPAKDTVNKKADKNAPTKPTEKTTGIRYHLSLLASSITSFGKILTEPKKTAKKTEEINKLLEHTITEKVSRGSALESATAVPAASGSNRGGAGGGLPAENGEDADPFLSLSDEELGTSLLEGLDEPAAEPQSTPADAASGPSQSDLEMPPLPDDMAAEADAILKANPDNGSNDMESLDGVEAIDDTLGDLDNINLDDIDLGDDSGTQEPAPPAPAPQSADGPDQQSHDLIPATPITPVVGVEGSSFDADQSDMSSFAAGTATGSDEDMLSSLASDIKHVKKETDLSLLRELKDFKAPATEIEKDLMDISEQLNALGKGEKKKIPSSQERK
jgi:hypothetical protein